MRRSVERARTARPAGPLAVVLALLAAACSAPVDAPPLGDYRSWGTPFVFLGPAPGHRDGDTYRRVYLNAVAADSEPPATGYSGYPDGSIFVKEVYDDAGGQPGALREIAIMRRVAVADPQVAASDPSRWLFSLTDAPGGTETRTDYCWIYCHVAAPYNGIWYDYRRRALAHAGGGASATATAASTAFAVAPGRADVGW